MTWFTWSLRPRWSVPAEQPHSAACSTARVRVKPTALPLWGSHMRDPPLPSLNLNLSPSNNNYHHHLQLKLHCQTSWLTYSPNSWLAYWGCCTVDGKAELIKKKKVLIYGLRKCFKWEADILPTASVCMCGWSCPGLISEAITLHVSFLFDFMQHFEIFKCFYGCIVDRRDCCGPSLFTSPKAEGKQKTLPAASRKLPTVTQQDQRWRAERCFYDLHTFNTCLI